MDSIDASHSSLAFRDGYAWVSEDHPLCDCSQPAVTGMGPSEAGHASPGRCMDVSPLEDRLLGGSMPSVGELQAWEDAALRTLQLTSCIRQFWHSSARQLPLQSPHRPQQSSHRPPPGLSLSHAGWQVQQQSAPHEFPQQLPVSQDAPRDPPQPMPALQSIPGAATAGLACQSGRPALHVDAADAWQPSLAPLRLALTGPSVTSPDAGQCQSTPATDCMQPSEGLQATPPATIPPPAIMVHLDGGPAGVLSNLPAAAAAAAAAATSARPKSVCAS